MKTYLPKKLDLNKHLKQFPPTSIRNFHIDYLRYILGLITEIPAKSEHFDSHTGMVPLNAETLRKKVRNYKQYLEYAVSTGILETDNSYIPGGKSKGYRFTEKYLDRVESVTIVKFSLVKQNRKVQSLDPNVKKKYSYLVKWFNENFEIDDTSALHFLNSYFESNSTEDDNVFKYNSYFCNIDKLKYQEYYISVDGTVNRFHSNLTGLKSEFRNFLTYASEELVSIDITNSQPYLSILLFKPDFYSLVPSSSKLNLFHLYNNSLLPPSTSFSPPPMMYKMLEDKDSQDVKHFIELVINGLFYEYLEKEIKDELGIVFQNRKDLKIQILHDMYTGNQYIGQPEAGPKRVFRDRFPTVYKIYSSIKKGDKPALPKLLQRIESYIVLDKVCKRISQERPFLPIFTIHDSVITTKGDEGYIETIMVEELSKCIGYPPRLKIEYWQQHEHK